MRHPTRLSWTLEQVARLEALIDSGATAFRAAAAMNRTIISVQTKARQLGKPFPHMRAVKRARLARESEANTRE